MRPEVGTLRERIAAVRAEIASAARRAGRREDEITLVAVTKTFPAQLVREAWEAGLRDFGENRVQEIVEKVPALQDLGREPPYAAGGPSTGGPLSRGASRQAPRFHMIGHLQTNKVKAVLPYIDVLHSLDRGNLIEEIVRRLPPDRVLPVLLQVNTTGEETKSGAAPLEVEALLAAVRAHASLDLRGLMTIGPLAGTSEDNRRAFSLLRKLRDRLAATSGLPLPWLSMGMSGDFPIAIEEGATHIRVGSRIFGERTP